MAAGTHVTRSPRSQPCLLAARLRSHRLPEPSMSSTVLNSVLANGGRTSRYGDYTVVFMHACTFITTPMEFMQMQNWARARMSCGNPVRDRTLFVDRFETVLARSGGGIATKGAKGVLQRIVKSMKANAMSMDEWSIPLNLDESVEIARKPVLGAVPQAGDVNRK